MYKQSRKQQSRGRGTLSSTQQEEVRRIVRISLQKTIEAKVTYTTQAGGIDYNGSTLNAVASLTRGDGSVDAFTGNLLKPVHFRLEYYWSTQQTFNVCRLLVFQFEDASAPAASGILQYTGSALAPTSPLNWTNVHKIHVLADQTVSMYPVAGSYAVKHGIINVAGNRMKAIQMPVAASSTPQMNGIYIVAISDDGIPSYPQLTFISELRFTDA